MTKLLKQAIAKIKTLSADQQDSIAQIILEELEDEHRWDDSFARSEDLLAELAAEAMTEHRAGKSQELNPETL
jgi:aspartate/glutamate racemase